MTSIFIVASVTLASGDVPLLLNKAFEAIGCRSHLWSIGEDLTFPESFFFENIHIYNRFIFNRRLINEIKLFQPDILLLYGSNWGVFPKTLKKIKSILPNCKIVLLEGNLHFWRWYQCEAFQYYDYLFVTDSYPIPLLKLYSSGLKNVAFIGQCCDPDEHGRMDLCSSDKKRFGAEVAFIGGGRSRRRDLFEQLTDYRLKLWGWGWDRSTKLIDFVEKETVFGLKKTKIYNATTICPNYQSGLYQVNGISPRIFEIACAGKLPFSEPQPDIKKFFNVGDDIVLFNSPEELRKKIDYHLKHMDETERMAERARQLVLSRHTYRHRAEQILNTVIDD